MKKRITFLQVFLLLLCVTVKAQTSISYYVDGSQATNGTGTLASPWNRIWYAINRVRDTTRDAIVYIKAGTYTIDSTNYLTQLYIGSANGGASGKYLTLRPYVGDEGKVIIDGSKLATNPFYPNMLVVSGAKYVKLQNLVFRSLKNTNGYAVNIQNAQSIEIRNCAFDTLRWTNTSAEYGYPTVNNTSNFINAIYLANNSSVTIANDTLRNSALGWGEFVRDAGGNTAVTQTALISTNVTAVASNYYVALTGNDTTGSGSITKPWRTIKKANELAGINYTYSPSKLVNAAVTINLRAGTHKPLTNGIFIGSNRGTNSQWFTIRNYPGENAIVDGSNITTKFSALFAIADAKYIRIEGLKLTKMTNDSALQNAAPSVGTKDTRFGIIVSGKSSNIIIKKNEIYDMAWTRNLAKQKIPTGSDNLNPLVILGTTDTSIRNVIIDSNTVYNNITGYAEAVTVNGNVDSFAINNNLVFDNANIGIVAAGNYQWVVDDASFTVTAAHNFSKNGFILNNTVYRNISPIAVSAGIYLDGSRNILVQNNESYNNGTGMSVGNEQSNSVSGYHTVNSNVFRDNLTAGLYYGSTNSTSWVEHCTVKNNTIKDNYVLDSVLRAKANNQYGITNASQRYTEVNIYRLRNSMFKQNTIESLSDIVLGLYLTQATDTLWYNEYYINSGDACQAIFVQDKNNDGSIVQPTDSIYFNFHQYAKRTGYDQNSSCEGQTYSTTGCGMPPAAFFGEGTLEELPLSKISITAWPNPVVNDLQIKLGLQKSGTVNMQIIDLSGRIVLQQLQQLVPGVHQLSVKGIKQKGISSGVYLLKITTPEEVKTIKIAVQ
ncbi:T9SS type A sorting domain-containing protein [Ferruginibacter sp.]|nr:T9SS type A sorting domain-containing protein [Ferruginibacter sp.]